MPASDPFSLSAPSTMPMRARPELMMLAVSGDREGLHARRSDSVRTAHATRARELYRIRVRCTADRRAASPPDRTHPGVPVLDVIYLLATLALFALVGLIAKGAERL